MDRLFASPVMVSAPDEEWEIYTLRRTLVQSFRCSIIPLAIIFRSENPAGSFEFGCAGARRLPYLSAQYDCALRLPKLADMMGGSPMAREVTGRSKAIPAARLLALALGAAAFGAVAIGALAIGRLAVGRLVIKKARFSALEVDQLTVRTLHIVEHDGPKSRCPRTAISLGDELVKI